MVIETPAGFQPNVAVLSDKVRTFFEHNLQNFQPQVATITARHRGSGELGTDRFAFAKPLEDADYIFAGAGSPTYAVRNLADSLVWNKTRERLRAGATLALASAMALAVSAQTLPVYEIYKAGLDLYWMPGLDIFREYGLDLTIVPHWNNSEGGAELDTSHCYMGERRFSELRKLLPNGAPILGIDEHTTAIVDLEADQIEVHGVGSVTARSGGESATYASGARFPLDVLRRC